ncbi:N-formylglutamate amidohydrolase [soil metagenome]
MMDNGTNQDDSDPWFRLAVGPGPVAAAAIHAGHAVRPPVAARLALDESQRLREEDPFTDQWTSVAPTRIVGCRSRFEIDLNRPREGAIYRTPDEAWGLGVWRGEFDEQTAARSLEIYDAFYRAVAGLFDDLAARCGHFVVLDLHSYNHRRDGPGAPEADPDQNPEVNIGTSTADTSRWAATIDAFEESLRQADFDGQGHHLDVRRNIRFTGGHFARWTHARYGSRALVLAVEFKKFFMDEWSGQEDRDRVEGIRRALAGTVPTLERTLDQIP